MPTLGIIVQLVLNSSQQAVRIQRIDSQRTSFLTAYLHMCNMYHEVTSTAQQNLNSYFKKKKYLFQAKNCLKQVRLFLSVY